MTPGGSIWASCPMTCSRRPSPVRTTCWALPAALPAPLQPPDATTMPGASITVQTPCDGSELKFHDRRLRQSHLSPGYFELNLGLAGFKCALLCENRELECPLLAENPEFIYPLLSESKGPRMHMRRCPTACMRRGVKEVQGGDERHQFVAGVHEGHVDLHVWQDAIAGAREGHGAGHQVRPPAPLDARAHVLAHCLRSGQAPALVSGLRRSARQGLPPERTSTSGSLIRNISQGVLVRQLPESRS